VLAGLQPENVSTTPSGCTRTVGSPVSRSIKLIQVREESHDGGVGMGGGGGKNNICLLLKIS